jgi:hypothetical protein
MRYRLMTDLIIPALLAGVVVGAMMVTAWRGAGLLMEGMPAAWLFITMIFFVSLAFWATGVVLMGAPVWAVLHYMNLRSPVYAVGAGGASALLALVGLSLVMSSGVADQYDRGRYVIQNGVRTADGWLSLLTDALLMGVAGGVVGMVIWRIAYRRIDAGPDRP